MGLKEVEENLYKRIKIEDAVKRLENLQINANAEDQKAIDVILEEMQIIIQKLN